MSNKYPCQLYSALTPSSAHLVCRAACHPSSAGAAGGPSPPAHRPGRRPPHFTSLFQQRSLSGEWLDACSLLLSFAWARPCARLLAGSEPLPVPCPHVTCEPIRSFLDCRLNNSMWNECSCNRSGMCTSHTPCMPLRPSHWYRLIDRAAISRKRVRKMSPPRFPASSQPKSGPGEGSSSSQAF